MKRLALIAVLMLVTLVAACAADEARPAPPRERPTVLFFCSDSCAYCQDMKRVVDEVCRKYRRQLDVVYVDMEQEDGKGLARKYGILSMPTVLLLDCEGCQVNVIRGTFPAAVVEQTVRDLVGK